MSAAPPLVQLQNAQEVQQAVREAGKILPTGAGTKPGLLRAGPRTSLVDMRGLTGIVEYEPAEYTITALAGTPVADLADALRANNQYLPFDPVLVAAGSTVGGLVASGLSGSGRLRYGGIRDFILGARFVDGSGRLIRGGGKVVKNAAGFDFPKLLVGSMGRLGIVTDATFKVFPQPPAYATVLAAYETVEAAIEDMQRLSVSPVELIAMDLVRQPDSDGYMLAVRIGGSQELIPARVERLQAMLPPAEILQDAEDSDLWAAVTEFTWAQDYETFVKVPLTPSAIANVEQALTQGDPPRRYAVAGNVLWLPWRGGIGACHDLLSALNLSGVVLRGNATLPLLGAVRESVFARRVKAALDPDDVFQPIYPGTAYAT